MTGPCKYLLLSACLALVPVCSPGAATAQPDAPPRRDAYGDPLPPGARLRLGRPVLHRSGPVWCVAYRPDGKILATTTRQQTRLWDVATGRELPPLQGHGGIVAAAVFFPDGNTLATLDGNSICVWDTTASKLLRRLDRYPHGKGRAVFATLACAPDGKLLASAGFENTIHFWDPATLKEVRRFSGHTATIRRVAFAPDGRTLASVDDERVLRVWDVASGRERWRQQGQGNGLSFAADGTLTSASTAGIHLWDVATGKEVRRVAVGQQRSYTLAISPDGRTLATGSTDSKVHLWDVATGKELNQLRGHRTPVGAVAFAPDGKTVASGGWDATFRVWDVATGRQPHQFPGHLNQVLAVACSPDGRTLATRQFDEPALFLWDARTGAAQRALPLPNLFHSSDPAGVAFSPDGQTVATAGPHFGLNAFAVATGQELPHLRSEHEETAFVLAFAPDGQTVVTTGFGAGLRRRDAATGQKRDEIVWPGRAMPEEGEGPYVSAVVFSPNGKVLAAACFNDPFPYLGDARTGRRWRPCQLPADEQINPRDGWLALAFSADGRMLVGLRSVRGKRPGVPPTAIHLWETATAGHRLRIDGPPQPLGALAVSPDGQLVAAAGDDAVVRLWDMRTGREVGRLAGHLGSVTCLAFLPDGRALVSGSRDTTFLVWDVPQRLQTTR